MNDYFEEEKKRYTEGMKWLTGDLQGYFTPEIVLAMMRLFDAVEKTKVEKEFQSTVMATLFHDDDVDEGKLTCISAMLKFAQRYDDVASSYRQLAVALQNHLKRGMGLDD